jgi:hypothetical protein
MNIDTYFKQLLHAQRHDQRLLAYRDATRRFEMAERWRKDADILIQFGFIYGNIVREMADQQMSEVF